MIEVQDEILGGEPIYNILDSDDNVIYSNEALDKLVKALERD